MTTINITYNKFLDPIFIGYIKSQEKWKDWEAPSQEEVLARVEAYKSEWKSVETEILSSLYTVTNLTFPREVIDVYIVSGSLRSFSDPVVIKSGFTPKEFVATLIHELIHRLFVLNNLKKSHIVDHKYTGEPETVQNHILLHALLRHIYRNVLKDSQMEEENIKKSFEHSTDEYSRAWEIVDQEGYQEIISDFSLRLRNKPLPWEGLK